MMDLFWQYFLIFIMAATPWLEILIVIPIGVGMGLNPIWVGIWSFVGNFLPIILIVYSLKYFQQTLWYERWQQKREKKKQIKQLDNQDIDSATLKKNRNERATAIFHKYGLPGLALVGPAITGIHLAAVIALSLKANKNKTTFWMGGSLFVWTIFLTIASYYSLDWITGLFS